MFRFTIRELVLVTLAVALCVGWAVDRTRLLKDAEAWKATSIFVKHLHEEAHDEFLKHRRITHPRTGLPVP